ncbi:MAG TPA: glucose 1-dehydrogenase [Phycisphaerae bacterium]|nr:glucose 1-dehydrogenase [Phycisphaerae bacterium]
MRLKDKVALITGANSGIGRGIAERFAAEGAHVAVNYLPGGTRDADAEAEVKAFPTDSLAVPADVSKRDQVEGMIKAVVAKFGRLDICVNNAGIEINKPFLEATDDQWNRVMSVNLFGAYVVAQTAAKQMVAQRKGDELGGKLIFISSVHEDIPFPGYTAYCASKGGMRMMMRNIAMELAPYKINCNNIAPGAIATPINQTVLNDPASMKNALSEIPWGRFGRPDEVAAVAVFLASAESEYVTGSTYYVDGGLTQQVTLY